MARDPKQPHRMLGENVIQSLLALLYQWGCYFGSLKGFQIPLTVRANNNVNLWSNVHMNFICTGQDNIYISTRKTAAYIPRQILSLLLKDYP
jgi:hypothetical protein